MLRILHSLFIVLASMTGVAEALSAEPLVIDDRLTVATLGNQVETWLDPTAALSAEQVTSPSFRDQFKPSAKPIPNFGYNSGAGWARFEIDYQGTPGRSVFLYFASPLVDLLEVYELAESGLVKRLAGDTVSIQTRSVRHRYPNFLITPKVGVTSFYVRLTGASPLQINPALASNEYFYDMTSQERGLNFLYFGIMIAMIAYNIFLYLSILDTVYLMYLLCVSSVFAVQWTLHGFHYQIFVNQGGDAANIWVGASIGAAAATSVMFAMSYLEIHRYHLLFRRLGQLLIAAAFFYTLGSIYGDYQKIASFGVPLSILTAIYCLTAGFFGLFRGLRSARFYTLAWSFFCLATIIEALRLAGVIASTPLTNDILQIGSAFEVILLSLGLADRIKLLQKEVYQTQKKALSEQRKANAELKKLGKMKDDFLANTSHELRTPLHAIVGLGEAILSQGNQDPETKYRLHMMLGSAKRLTLLVNDILDFSKLRHRRIELHEKPLDLAVLGQYVVEMMRPLLGQKPVELRLDLDESLTLVLGDEDRLQQILFNLVGNALKFTERGQVILKMTREENRVFFRIIDTGIGIPAEKLENIFEAFTQADGSIERQYGGTGLGLSITRKLVELHGGKITVHSEEGKGTQFTVSLPLRDVPEGSLASRQDEAEPLSKELREHILFRTETPSQLKPNLRMPKNAGVRILVADDDPYNLEVLVAQLTPEGYEVETAGDGQSALHLVMHGPTFDLALLDVMMPKMNGFELTRKIRELKDHIELPILLLTAKSQTEDVLKGFEMGANDYLLKPFARQELLARLEIHRTIRNQAQTTKLLSTEIRNEMEAKRVMVQDLAHRTNNPLHAATLALDLIQKELQRFRELMVGLFGDESQLDEDGKACLNEIKESFLSLQGHEQFIRGNIDRVVVAIREIRILCGIDGRPLEEVQFQDALSSAILRLEYSMGVDAIRRLEFDWLSDCRYLLVTHPIVLALCLEKILRQVLSSTSDELLIPVTWLEEGRPGLRMEFKSTGARVLTLPEDCQALWQHISYTLKPYGIRLEWNGQEPYLELRNLRSKPLEFSQEAS